MSNDLDQWCEQFENNDDRQLAELLCKKLNSKEWTL